MRVVVNLLVICIVSLLCGCSSRVSDANMRWVSKYNFMDLYKRKINGNMFNPGSGLSIDKIVIPNENTIVLGGIKSLREFNDDDRAEDCVVLFVSKDKGKSYKEILLTDTDLEVLEVDNGFVLTQTFTSSGMGYRNYNVQLLNIKNLEVINVDKFSDVNVDRFFEENVRRFSDTNVDIYYFDFVGNYALKRKGDNYKVVNLFNVKEEYSIPFDIIDHNIFHIGDTKIVYRSNHDQVIKEYNAKTKETRLIKKLNGNYAYWMKRNGEIFLKKVIEEKEDGHVYRYGIYDMNENKLYEETSETEYYYRYKNFVCDFTELGAKPTLRYSYDYGNTWTTHNITDFTIMRRVFGFYQNKFLVTEGIYWRGDSEESGGRIMVGEFTPGRVE
ncbi:hypothetical protein HX039_12450 [Myroides marinus]|uniref:hypothetical protein n=1 Tax=Myroides TaxID=76831 RepID=UPI0025754DEC|nr:hypothetical protein [Myroides marinus]MDM1404915.1 hypothetical protein [Myroides marinus]